MHIDVASQGPRAVLHQPTSRLLFRPLLARTSKLLSMSFPPKDDSFELYDLRVEVVSPPGERIMCGAKEGDFFTLEGEMLYLPPGQGMSIYSLGGLFFWHELKVAGAVAQDWADVPLCTLWYSAF